VRAGVSVLAWLPPGLETLLLFRMKWPMVEGVVCSGTGFLNADAPLPGLDGRTVGDFWRWAIFPRDVEPESLRFAEVNLTLIFTKGFRTLDFDLNLSKMLMTNPHFVWYHGAVPSRTGLPLMIRPCRERKTTLVSIEFFSDVPFSPKREGIEAASSGLV
jgi:hypothetical protein